VKLTTKKRVGWKRKKLSKKRFIEVHPLCACLLPDMYVKQPKTYRWWIQTAYVMRLHERKPTPVFRRDSSGKACRKI
jgi:hypothetical protein